VLVWGRGGGGGGDLGLSWYTILHGGVAHVNCQNVLCMRIEINFLCGSFSLSVIDDKGSLCVPPSHEVFYNYHLQFSRWHLQEVWSVIIWSCKLLHLHD
jgi:hypothetical protein